MTESANELVEVRQEARVRTWALVGVLITLVGALASQYLDVAATIVSAFLVAALWLTLLAVALDRRPAQVAPVPAQPVQKQRPWEDFRRELARARRYHRTFVLVRVPAKALVPLVPRPMRMPLRRVREPDLGRAIGSRLRRLDVVWVDDGAVYLLLPECGPIEAELFMVRLQGLASGALPRERIAWATFPDDGLTTHALLEALEEGGGPPGLSREPAGQVI